MVLQGDHERLNTPEPRMPEGIQLRATMSSGDGDAEVDHELIEGMLQILRAEEEPKVFDRTNTRVPSFLIRGLFGDGRSTLAAERLVASGRWILTERAG